MIQRLWRWGLTTSVTLNMYTSKLSQFNSLLLKSPLRGSLSILLPSYFFSVKVLPAYNLIFFLNQEQMFRPIFPFSFLTYMNLSRGLGCRWRIWDWFTQWGRWRAAWLWGARGGGRWQRPNWRVLYRCLVLGTACFLLTPALLFLLENCNHFRLQHCII